MAAPASFPKLNVYEAGALYRQRLLVREQSTVDDTIRRWLVARHEIERELDALVRQVEAALRAGRRPVVLPFGGDFAPDEFSASWLFRIGRMENLVAAIEAEVAKFNAVGLEKIGSRINNEIGQGELDAQKLLGFRVRDDGLVTPRQFASLPNGALQQLVSFVGPDGPLPKAFDGMGPELVRQVQQRLVTGLAKGENPRVIAAKMRRDTVDGGLLDAPLYKQMRVARTEPLRAYRESGRLTYLANSDVVSGWEWNAFPGPRTCAFCLAMDGTRHRLDEPMGTHPQCRCVKLPITELSGDPEFAGARYLYSLSPDEQDQVFGSHTMGELYRKGKISLADIPEQFNHPDWGKSGRAASMRSLQGRGVITQADILEAKASNTSRPRWAFKLPNATNIVPVVPQPAPKPATPPSPAPAPAPKRKAKAAQETPGATAEQVAKAWRPLGADGRSGINTTGVAEVNGRKFIVKVLDSTISGSRGEFAAAEVAQHMGVTRLLPESYENFSKEVAKAMGKADVFVAKFEDGLDALSAQTYERMAALSSRPYQVLKFIDRADREDAVLFDYVIGNGDRHGQNILGLLDEGRILLIDHERAFRELPRLDSYHFMVENDMDADARADKMEFVLSRQKVQRIVANRAKIENAAKKRKLDTEFLGERLDKLERLLESGEDITLGDLFR